MGLDSFEGSNVESKYGEVACKEACRLDDTGISEGSARTYKPQVRQVISQLEPNPDVDAVVEVIKGCDKGDSAKNTMVMAMKKYFSAIDEFSKAESLGDKASTVDLDINFDSSRKVDQFVKQEEVELILEKLCPPAGKKAELLTIGTKNFRTTLEHKALVATLFYTGLRVSEVKLLEYSDFYFEDNEVIVYRVKKGGDVVEEDRIYQTDQYLNIIKDYTNVYSRQSGEIFPMSVRTIENRIDEIEEAYCEAFEEFDTCENLTPHKFRHGRVTSIAREFGLEKASQYVGHESIETTRRYSHLVTEDQEQILPEAQDDKKDVEVEEFLEDNNISTVEELKEALDT